MNILIVHQYFLSKDAAGGTRWNEMARFWAEKGHDVTVLAGMVDYNTGKKPPEYSGRYIVRENPLPGIEVLRCHVSQSYNASFLGRAWAYFSFAFSSIFAGLFYAKRPQVIVATSPPLTVAVTMRWLKWIRRCPAIFEVRDLWPESALDTGVLKPGKLANMLYKMERNAYRDADWINVLTPAFKEKLIDDKGISAEKISVITNGADPDIVMPGPKKNDVRTELNLHNKFAVGYFGAHGKANHLTQLLNAAEILLERDPEVQIVLVGDGMEKSILRSEAKSRGLSNVTFVDPVAKEKVADYINAMDVCTAVLMKNDTFKTVYPNKVFDYMCCERPTIIAIDGVARKLVEDADAGIFVEPENPEAMVEAILKLKSDPDLCEKYGRQGREFVINNYTRKRLALRYLEIVERIATK